MPRLGFLDLLDKSNALRNDEWDPEGKLDLSFFGNELAGEVGEACNKIKKLERERLGLRGSRTTHEELMDELADVVIVASIIAGKIGGDLETAIVQKFNETSKENGLSIFL